MATIYNSDITKELRDGGKISLRDAIPNQLAEKVVPVMEVNPKLLRRAISFSILNSLSNATSATLYTTATDKDTYLTGMTLSYIKDVTATSTEIALTIVPEETNVATPVMRCVGLTLTAQQETVWRDFSIPIKLKRGSNILLTSSTNVATISAKASLQGYEVFNSNA